MAVDMLFLAGPRSLQITRLIAQGARAAGYDSVIYRRKVNHTNRTRGLARDSIQ